jgi:hypothetical protein
MIGILSAVPATIPGCTSSGNGIICTGTAQSGVSAPLTQSSGLGLSSLASLAGIVVDVLAVVIFLALIGVFVIVVVANRADPDPTGRRPQAVYFFAVSFVTITSSIIGSAVVVSAILRLFGHHASSVTDSVARTLVLGGLVTLVSMFLLLTHLRRGLALARADGEVTSPSLRVGQSYVSAVAFLAVLALLVVAVFSVYLIFALAGPGVFGSFGGRGDTLRILIEVVYLGVVADLVLWTHRNLLTPGLNVFSRMAGAGAPPPTQPPVATPSEPPA